VRNGERGELKKDSKGKKKGGEKKNATAGNVLEASYAPESQREN
jgi:hypothetical protein